jgi:hypothetical protein
MRFITLQFPYTLNGTVRWAENVAHEANDELRGLLADGVAGIEHGDEEPVEPVPEGEKSAEAPQA